MKDVWAISKLLVCAEVNTPQLKTFIDHHDQHAPTFSREVPVIAIDDETLQQSWGTSSLPESLHPRVLRSTFVKYVFKTRCTPPIKWVTRVSKMYRDLAFDLTYAIPALTLTGWMWRSGDITQMSETEGMQREVDEFLLSVE